MNMFQDIQISDGALRNQFVNYFLNGDYQSAFNIVNNNEQLNNKAFVAKCINDIAEILYATEDSVISGSTGKLNDLSIGFNEVINQFLNKGEWIDTEIYKLYNFVLYNENVYMYINDTPTMGNIPTNSNYWLEIGLKGKKGAGGCTQLHMKFYWQSNVQYQPYDLVMTVSQEQNQIGNMWVAKTANMGQVPSESSIYWEKFIEATSAYIYSSEEQPTDRYIGQIWFDMS